MDGLWDPPIYQASEDYNCINDGCRCAFWTAYDVMEETAQNEKSCKQVLRILLSKADDDIIELEEELVDLLSELAYTDEELLDMFSISLKVKINFLDLSIRKLKDDAGDFLSTRREPAESIHDILKSVFCVYLQKKDEQKSADDTTNVASSCHQLCADNLLKEKEQGGSSSNANQMEKSKRIIITSLEKHKISQTRVKMEEEDANYCENTNDFAAPFDDLHKSVPGLCRGSMEKMNRAVNEFQINSPTMAKDGLLNMTTGWNLICKKPSLETQGKWKHHLKMIKSQTDDEGISSRSIRLVELSEEPNTMATVSSETTFYLDNRAKSNPISLGTKRALALSNTQRCAPDALLDFSRHRINIERPKQRRVREHVDEGNTNLVLKQESDHEEEQSMSLSLMLSSPKTYKRRQKPGSPLPTSSSSAGLLEGAKESCSCSHGTDAASLHDGSETVDMTLDELKAIAKQRKLKGYSKFRKLELAQKLGIKLVEKKRNQKRKETPVLLLTQGEL